MTIELLRRLTIISIEDVAMNKYYPMVVWYFVAVSSAKYILTTTDKMNIYSYVGLLCDIGEGEVEEFKGDEITMEQGQQTITENIYCLSLNIREQYGGFDGERKLIRDLIFRLEQNKLMVIEKEMQMLQYDVAIMKPIKIHEILDCAIDFHCFPKMPTKVLQKIDMPLA
ncbi:MAG: hypothetical protein EBX50_19515, partial [Chitinophagia bacterium]|nr:hypothetical protein [Chitinophagia bacterium]